jgi:RNA polymerase sigma-70 factor (ECF subfamily)
MFAQTSPPAYPREPIPGFDAAPSAAEAGGRAVFEALFQRHREELHWFLYRKLRNAEDAEDAVSVTFFKAWRAWSGFRGEASYRNWLYQIGNRVVLDVLRARRARPVEHPLLEGHPEVTGLPDGSPDPAENVLEEERVSELQSAVHRAVDRLSPVERRLLSLYYFEGYKYEEISSLLGIPYTKVRGRLHRIRQTLRRDLTDRQCWRPA